MLLAACAQQPRLESPLRPARATIVSYTLEGRISVKRGATARQAALVWQHNAERDEIELSGPLGQKAARLSRDAGGARLETASRETVVANDWSSLAERVLGVALPLDNLAHWVTATTIEAERDTQRDPVGRPLRVWDSGWQINYLTYESAAPDALPTLIELHRDDIDVRLKIDTWQLD
ncbi:Outer membrane lipoprotein LolB precursor [Georgfuchsia toluolica]|uniref:Outer-membrane lipoprotein LolB n=2 Tax=Georgfuchsia toluolica TaxID=424218 RepID=A0A916J5X3_9PROT|nr:Outer membrane lipoprotein LolB precursor [Georgfuchsia toluolica]